MPVLDTRVLVREGKSIAVPGGSTGSGRTIVLPQDFAAFQACLGLCGVPGGVPVAGCWADVA